ncbi:MAG: hypothetical protein MMC33_002344 [Icmadophila ericetorum]|nr:hypothetical protein [Icmadophila ericetorum]
MSPSVSPLSSQSNETSPNGLTRPPTPERWQWQCCGGHENSTWALTVTNRCLICGHKFCAGREEGRGRSKSKGRYCSSYFDYAAWEKMGRWRRAVMKGMKEISSTDGNVSDSDDEEEEQDLMKRPKNWNCEADCDFPSECRWIPKLMSSAASGNRGGGADYGGGGFGPADEDFEKEYNIYTIDNLGETGPSGSAAADIDDAGYEGGDESEEDNSMPI